VLYHINSQLKLNEPHFGQFMYSWSSESKLHRLHDPYSVLMCIMMYLASLWLNLFTSINCLTAWSGDTFFHSNNCCLTESEKVGISIPSFGIQCLHWMFMD